MSNSKQCVPCGEWKMNEFILTVVETGIFFGGMTYAAKKGHPRTENQRIQSYLAGVVAGAAMLLGVFYFG